MTILMSESDMCSENWLKAGCNHDNVENSKVKNAHLQIQDS